MSLWSASVLTWTSRFIRYIILPQRGFKNDARMCLDDCLRVRAMQPDVFHEDTEIRIVRAYKVSNSGGVSTTSDSSIDTPMVLICRYARIGPQQTAQGAALGSSAAQTDESWRLASDHSH